MISYCIPVMDRLNHLKQTLPANLMATDNHAEFVILNYSDQSGLDEWMQGFLTDLPPEQALRVKYFIHTGETKYNQAKAKNIAHKQSTGDIVCNVDADYFLGDLHNELMSFGGDSHPFRGIDLGNKEIVLCKQLRGFIACTRTIFNSLGGYDETIQGWGYEDRGFWKRAEARGWGITLFDCPTAKAIAHSNEERFKHTNQDLKSSLWAETLQRGELFKRIREGRLEVNEGKEWGKINPPMTT